MMNIVKIQSIKKNTSMTNLWEMTKERNKMVQFDTYFENKSSYKQVFEDNI